MKFTCNKLAMMENINIVLKAVSAKSAAPILEGIYIKASARGGHRRGFYDGERIRYGVSLKSRRREWQGLRF